MSFFTVASHLFWLSCLLKQPWSFFCCLLLQFAFGIGCWELHIHFLLGFPFVKFIGDPILFIRNLHYWWIILISLWACTFRIFPIDDAWYLMMSLIYLLFYHPWAGIGWSLNHRQLIAKMDMFCNLTATIKRNNWRQVTQIC